MRIGYSAPVPAEETNMEETTLLPRIPALIAAGLCAFALVIWLGAAVTAVAEGNPDGKAVFMAQKCDMCHGVSGAAIAATTKSDKMKGPDLSGYVPKDATATSAYLRLKGELEGKKHKKEFKGTDAELNAVLAWLKEQKKAS